MYAEGMLERIYNQISKADVIVAEMTGRNANVFYEVGYAHALNKIVLLLTRDTADIPFDLQHRPHISCERAKDLRPELAKWLTWAIDESRRRGTQAATRSRLTISLMGTELPEGLLGAPVPTVTLWPPGRSVAFHVRNDGPEESAAISHLYLFTEADSPIVPARIVVRKEVEERQFSFWETAYRQTPLPKQTVERDVEHYERLSRMRASPADWRRWGSRYSIGCQAVSLPFRREPSSYWTFPSTWNVGVPGPRACV